MKGIEYYLFSIFSSILFLRWAKLLQGKEKLPLTDRKDGGVYALNKYGLCLFACLTPVFLATFRHVSVGTDTGSVYHPYYYMPYCVFGERYTGTETGFYLVIRLGYLLFRGFPGVLFTIAILTTGISFFALEELTEGKFCFLTIIYVLAFWYFDSFNIMRQALASAIVLFGWRYLRLNEPFLYGVCVVIAFFFHNSALFALAGIFFYAIRNRKNLYFATLCALPFLVFLLPTGLTILQKLGLFQTYIERYKGTGFDFQAVNFSLVVYRLPVYALFLLFGKRLYREDGFTRVLLLFSACALGCYLCKIRMVWLTRLSGYMLFSEGLLVEKCVKYVKNKQLFSAFVCLYAVAYFVIIYGVLKNGEILPFVWGIEIWKKPFAWW